LLNPYAVYVLPFTDHDFVDQVTDDLRSEFADIPVVTDDLNKHFCVDLLLIHGREMIFDCPSGLSWNLTGEGGAGGRPAAGAEETIKEPSFSSMETDIFPFFQFK